MPPLSRLLVYKGLDVCKASKSEAENFNFHLNSCQPFFLIHLRLTPVMDPLSVSASIIGVLSAAAKVSSVLIPFAQNTKAAPKLAQTVLADINGLSTVLSHLQTYLLGYTTPSKSRASLILVEQVIVTLTECVITFSELEDVLGTSKDMGVLDRIKWAMKESKISDIQRRLQSDKSSLTLMLTILQWFVTLSHIR